MRSAHKALQYFREICSIPHPSFHMEAISDYCVEYAKRKGYEVRKDEACNVVMKVPGTSSRRYEPPVILQAHLDMVPAAAEGVDFDFTKDSLRLIEDEDWITADGTTLGADDGIGVAICLGLFECDDLPHPPIICVFTANEEVGMLGAHALDLSDIKAPRMINLDHGEEGSAVIGCAGGVTAEVTLPVTRKEVSGDTINISISGLKGGHSGEKINEGGANGIRMQGRIMREMIQNGYTGFMLSDFKGGNAENAIPTSSFCQLIVPEGEGEAAREAAEIAADILRARWRKKEPGLKIEITVGKGSANALVYDSTKALARLLRDVPNGLMKMSEEMPDLTETSLNLGLACLGDDTVKLTWLLRSSVDEEKKKLQKQVENVAAEYGAFVHFSSDYPGWPVKTGTPLQTLASLVWEWENDDEFIIEATHGGLECGVFAQAYPNMDIISVGPHMENIHTPDERLSVYSVEKFWNFLVRLIEEL